MLSNYNYNCQNGSSLPVNQILVLIFVFFVSPKRLDISGSKKKRDIATFQ